MIKKYAPYIVLLIAALLLYFIMTHQRGSTARNNIDITTNTLTGEAFSRHPDSIIYTKHARCRMECRHITENEVKEILETGKVNEAKIDETDRGKTYPIDGRTKADKMVRIVVSPKKNDLVVVTVIDLDKDWPCDCH